MSPRDTLTKGALLLEPALKPHRFSFSFREEGQGSGGHFATGDFIRGDRRLELHFEPRRSGDSMPETGRVSSAFWNHFNTPSRWTPRTEEGSKSQGVELSPANKPLQPTSE